MIEKLNIPGPHTVYYDFDKDRMIVPCKHCGRNMGNIPDRDDYSWCSDDCDARPKVLPKSTPRVKKHRAVMTEDAYIREVYSRYKRRAKKKGMDFDLDVSDFESCKDNDCYYCGSSFDKAGFDRVDSSIGYTKSNVVPCCAKCNRMKNSHTVEDWVSHMKRVIHHIESNPEKQKSS